jgi:EAL domain-containing protein (putative c-di-GMP-specific phosphodiesterase class I)
MDCLTRLKAIGVGLAIDDFGTAFSSISYLRRFPFDHLKLDLSFTNDLPHSTRTLLLVEQIGHMADSMKMMSIAEGIENEEQAEALGGIGWTFGQGYLFSRPMHPSSCHAMLSTGDLRT